MVKDLAKFAKDKGVKYFMISYTDLFGGQRAKLVPTQAINDMAEVFADPQVIARGMQIAPEGLPGVRSPMRFSGADLALDRPAPRLGQHQDEVLGKKA